MSKLKSTFQYLIIEVHCRWRPESVYAPVSSFELRINKARVEQERVCGREMQNEVELNMVNESIESETP